MDERGQVLYHCVVAGGEEEARVKKVLEIFSGRNARLITLSGEEAGGGSQTAEMTHEALLEHWTDLKAWLDEDRDALRLQRRLESAADEWAAQERPAGLLWRSPDLDRVQALYTAKKDDFSKLKVDFYRASERALRWKWFWRAVVVVLIVVGIGAAFVLVKRQEIIAKINEKNANSNIAKLYESQAGISLVPVEDGPPGGTGPWYVGYPQPERKDPVQWMVESAAEAVSENKLTLDGIPKPWIEKITGPGPRRAESEKEPEAVEVELPPDEKMTFAYIHRGVFLSSDLLMIGTVTVLSVSVRSLF